MLYKIWTKEESLFAEMEIYSQYQMRIFNGDCQKGKSPPKLATHCSIIEEQILQYAGALHRCKCKKYNTPPEYRSIGLSTK